MPRPGQTPTPAYETGTDLPYGSARQVADLQSAVPALAQQIAELPEPEEGEEEYVPQGDEESFIFSPTDRPEEPVTAGAAFGTGPDFTRFAYESDADFLSRVVTQLDTPDAPREVKAFAERYRRGL